MLLRFYENPPNMALGANLRTIEQNSGSTTLLNSPNTLQFHALNIVISSFPLAQFLLYTSRVHCRSAIGIES